jgi:hypothetical protein
MASAYVNGLGFFSVDLGLGLDLDLMASASPIDVVNIPGNG